MKLQTDFTHKHYSYTYYHIWFDFKIAKPRLCPTKLKIDDVSNGIANHINNVKTN